MINLIVATDIVGNIGKDNKLLWSLPNDLKRFKSMTSGKTVVMGRKTFESLGKPLKGRKNIVLTTNDNLYSNTDLMVEYKSLDTFMDDYLSSKEGDVWCIGGGEVYKKLLSMNLIGKIELTLVDTLCENSDTIFPMEALNDFVLEKEVINFKDAKHEFNYYYQTYIRQYK